VSTTTATSERGRGFAFAIASYVWWGFLPLYFVLLVPSGAVEIVAWRIVLSVVFCALIIVVTRAWAPFLAIVRDRRSMLLLAAASVFILVNWLVYVFAAVSGHVVEASLGYFINPIVTVLLGVIVLRERLRVLQWVAVGVSAVAVVVLAINYGQLPWISLVLAVTFGLYGLVKKQVGPKVDAVSGLTIETAYLAPAASIALIVIAVQGDLSMGSVDAWHTVLLLFAGVITAVPLLLFASGARRLPLVYMGLVQYFAPVLQLIIGAWIMQEAMPPARWAGFAIVWVALAILSFDGLRHGTRQRAAALATTPEGAP
jgi:chloramphenicol-sensitive protein RarD